MLKLETTAHTRSTCQQVNCFSTFPARINVLACTDTAPIDKIQPAGSASTLPRHSPGFGRRVPWNPQEPLNWR